jgi:hypothetical protein
MDRGAVQSSPRLHQNEEGVSAVLTEVFGGLGDDGGSPDNGEEQTAVVKLWW